MRILKTKIYTFKELSKDAQEKAINSLRDYNVDFDSWSEPVLDDTKEKLEALGYYDINTSFRGFWSQGDGASFTASIDVLKFLKAHKLTNKYRALYNALKANEYAVAIKIIRINHHYVHENTTQCEIVLDMGLTEKIDLQAEKLKRFIDNEIVALNKDIYKELEIEYDYLTSDEAIIETILSNEYEFTINGELI